MSLIVEAALKVGITKLLNLVIAVAKQSKKFKSRLKSLEETLLQVQSEADKIDSTHSKLNVPKEDTDHFFEELKRGMDLVDKCHKIPCFNFKKLSKYSKKLEALEESILKFFNIKMMGHIAMNVGLLAEHANSTDGNSSTPISGLSSLRDLPVGFDEPLKDVKKMLLNDMKTVEVIAAPGGCGKTTLAKMLCHDPQIQGKFGDNILFVTVSKAANTIVIAKEILRQLPAGQIPDFQNENHAIDHLECSLKKIDPAPILLVLDDVWPHQEDLIRRLSFNFMKYKILVTSRYSFPVFIPVYNLEFLNDEYAMTLFRQHALPKDGSSKIPPDLLKEMVKSCKGCPLALQLLGRSLCGRDEVIWRRESNKLSAGKSLLHSNEELLNCLQISVDALKETDSSLWDCFLDLGLFPEDQRIPATTLMDMWGELYDLDDEDTETGSKLTELKSRTLVNLDYSRKVGIQVDGYCKEYFVMLHDLIRDLSILQSDTEPVEHRRRLIIEIAENVFPKWWTKEMHHPMHARILSISTDTNFSSSWHHLTLPEAEVVILNCRSGLYTIPQFIEGMNKLKVLIITNYGPFFSKLYNFQHLKSLPILKRIRLERVSVSSLDTSLLKLVNLQKISFTMCEIGKAFENGTIDLSLVFPNLLEIEIDYCEHLSKLYVGLCNIVSLKKISITYCNELSTLPEEIGRLINLEVLRLSSCTMLKQLPESIGDLQKLKVLDISDCLSISSLPGRVGELCALKTIHMRGCQGLSKLHHLPSSVKNLRLLKTVMCDKDTRHLWKPYENILMNLQVEEVEEDALESLSGILMHLTKHF